MSLQAEIKTALTALSKSMAAGRLAHAYLIVGPPRGAATALAEAILGLLYCTAAAAARPCGTCAVCRQLKQHIHPDLLWVEPQKKTRTIQKEQVQQIQEHVLQTSLVGGWKAIVLLHAERLHEMAANKLLKTLEEPPPRCLFLLLSGNPEFLPSTIISRCQRLTLGGSAAPDDAALKAAVAQIVTSAFEPDLLGGLAYARRIQDLLEDLRATIEAAESSAPALSIQAQPSAEPSAAAAPDPALRQNLKEAAQARIEGRYRESRQAVLGWLLCWQRDLLLSVCGLPTAGLYFPEESARLQDQARGLTYRQVLHNIHVVEEMKDQLEQLLPENMVLERGLTRLNHQRRR